MKTTLMLMASLIIVSGCDEPAKSGKEAIPASLAQPEPDLRPDTMRPHIVISGGKTNQIPSMSDDFIMGSQTAVSNAMFFNAPPNGWGIVCDRNGHFASRLPCGGVLDFDDQIRTNRFEAIVSAWRSKEIYDTYLSKQIVPEYEKHYSWQDCSGD